jgi:hypothetical protein
LSESPLGSKCSSTDNIVFSPLTLLSGEFLHRTELSFRAIHERIVYLEERQAVQGPSDEQVERVLRRILAEKFSSNRTEQVKTANVLNGDDYFVENRKDMAVSRPVAFDLASLLVDPESVPSKAYAETFQMLEDRLARFPHINTGGGTQVSPAESFDVKEPNSRGSL